MSELKAMKFFEAVPTSKEGFYQPGAFVNGYLKSEADKVIAEKDAEIRRLNHKYWNDKADEAAKMKRLIQDGQIIYLDEYCNEKDWHIMHKVWKDEETKCRAKAEQYK